MTAATVTPLHAAALAWSKANAHQGRFITPDQAERDPALQAAVAAALGVPADGSSVVAMRDAEIDLLRRSLSVAHRQLDALRLRRQRGSFAPKEQR